MQKVLNDAEDLYDEKGGINQKFIDKEVSKLTPEMQDSVKQLLNSSEVKSSLNSATTAAKSGASGIDTAKSLLSLTVIFTVLLLSAPLSASGSYIRTNIFNITILIPCTIIKSKPSK